MAGLRQEGKLDRAVRALARATELCPESEAATWATEVSLLTEVGALVQARAVAKVIGDSPRASAEAKEAARLADAEAARQLVLPGHAAKAAARKEYRAAAAALLGKDYEAARSTALKAWAMHHPNPEALLVAGRAVKARGTWCQRRGSSIARGRMPEGRALRRHL